MPQDDKLKLLYDDVKKDYEVGTIDEFKAYLSDDKKRDAFFKEVIQPNYDVKNLSDFESVYDLKKKAPTASPTASSTPSPTFSTEPIVPSNDSQTQKSEYTGKGPNYNIDSQVKKEDSKGYGLRNDGSKKGRGFFGELPNKNGDVSTELSIGVDLGKGEQEIPSLVPTLTPQEKDWLLEGNNDFQKGVGKVIADKAIDWHNKRKAEGKSPYAGNESYLDYEKRFNPQAKKVNDANKSILIPFSPLKVKQPEGEKDFIQPKLEISDLTKAPQKRYYKAYQSMRGRLSENINAVGEIDADLEKKNPETKKAIDAFNGELQQASQVISQELKAKYQKLVNDKVMTAEEATAKWKEEYDKGYGAAQQEITSKYRPQIDNFNGLINQRKKLVDNIKADQQRVKLLRDAVGVIERNTQTQIAQEGNNIDNAIVSGLNAAGSMIAGSLPYAWKTLNMLGAYTNTTNMPKSVLEAMERQKKMEATEIVQKLESSAKEMGRTSQYYSNKITQKEGTIVDNFTEGNYGKVVKISGIRFVESLPSMAAAIGMTAATGGAGSAIIPGGFLFGAQNYYGEYADRPDMTEDEKLNASFLKGSLEMATEISVLPLLTPLKSLLKTSGKEAAKEAIEKTLFGTIKEGYKKYLPYFGWVQEGTSEYVNAVGGKIVDKLYDPKFDEKNWGEVLKEANKEGWEAFGPGAFGGGALTLPTVINTVINSYKNKLEARNYASELEKIDKDIESANLTDAQKDILITRKQEIHAKLNDLFDADKQETAGATTEQIEALDDINDQQDEVKTALQDETLSPESKEAFELKAKELAEQEKLKIEEIKAEADTKKFYQGRDFYEQTGLPNGNYTEQEVQQAKDKLSGTQTPQVTKGVEANPISEKTQARIAELELQRDKEIANYKVLFTDNPSEEVKAQRIAEAKQEIANDYNSEIEAIKQKATERATKNVERTDIEKQYPIEALLVKEKVVDGDNKLLEGEEADYQNQRIEKTISSGIKKGLDAQTIFAMLSANGHVFNFGNDSIAMNNYIKNRIDGRETRTFDEFKQNPQGKTKSVESNVVEPTTALKDVESTTKALEDFKNKVGVTSDAFQSLSDFAPENSFGIVNGKDTGKKITDVIAELYHADKAAAKETKLVKSVESLLSKEQTPTLKDVEDVEYNDFIDKGKVSDERLNDIAQKVKDNKKLSDREKAIFTDKTSEINKIIAAQAENTPSQTKLKVKNEFDEAFGEGTILVGSTSKGEAKVDSDIDVVMGGMPHQGLEKITPEQARENSKYAIEKLQKLADKGTITDLELKQFGNMGVTFKFKGEQFQIVPNPQAKDKVVDSGVAGDVKPLEGYHYTDKDFTEFEQPTETQSLGNGTYFYLNKRKSTKKEVTSELNVKKVLDWKELKDEERNTIIKELEKAKIPTDRLNDGKLLRKAFNKIDDAQKFSSDKKAEGLNVKTDLVNGEYIVEYKEKGLLNASNDKLRGLAAEFDPNIAKRLGYDAAKLGDEIVVFDVKNIKINTKEQSLPTQEVKGKPLSDQIADLRAEEQAKYDAMSNPKDEAARKEIYDRYDKLITPLLEKQKVEKERTRQIELLDTEKKIVQLEKELRFAPVRGSKNQLSQKQIRIQISNYKGQLRELKGLPPKKKVTDSPLRITKRNFSNEVKEQNMSLDERLIFSAIGTLSANDKDIVNSDASAKLRQQGALVKQGGLSIDQVVTDFINENDLDSDMAQDFRNTLIDFVNRGDAYAWMNKIREREATPDPDAIRENEFYDYTYNRAIEYDLTDEEIDEIELELIKLNDLTQEEYENIKNQFAESDNGTKEGVSGLENKANTSKEKDAQRKAALEEAVKEAKNAYQAVQTRLTKAKQAADKAGQEQQNNIFGGKPADALLFGTDLRSLNEKVKERQAEVDKAKESLDKAQLALDNFVPSNQVQLDVEAPTEAAIVKDPILKRINKAFLKIGTEILDNAEALMAKAKEITSGGGKIDFSMNEAINQSENVKLKYDSNGKHLAPNGKPSNLTEQQAKIVRTPAFKNWFGDWENDPKNASKIVDKNGEPLVVYHGSPETEIQEFDRNLSKRKSGIKEYGNYFATNKVLSELYARGSGRIYPVFLNLRTVKEFNAKGENNIEAWRNLEVDAGYKIANNRDAMDFLQEGKFGVEKVDGVWAKNIVDMFSQGVKEVDNKYIGESILVFDNTKNAIKLADGTNTTFDSKVNDIRYNTTAGFETRDGKPIGFRYDTDQVARERFDFSKLKQIGKGSDRTVFDLGNGKVLKVAHTARGLEQNIYEGDSYLAQQGLIPEAFERGLNYIVVENVEPAISMQSTATNFKVEKSGKSFIIVGIDNGYVYGVKHKTIESAEAAIEKLGISYANEIENKKANEKLNKMLADLKKFTYKDFDNKTADLQEVLEKYDISGIMDYDVLWGDYTAKRNWGLKNGEPIHLDGGTFGGVRMLTSQKGNKPLDDPEFRAIYNKSKQLKKQFGDTDKNTRFNITMPDGSEKQVKPIDVDVVNGFYSPLEKVINEAKQDKLPAKQWIEKFAKGEEAKWTGLNDWLNTQQGSVSKADIQQYLKDNRIEVVEVVKKDDADSYNMEDYEMFPQEVKDIANEVGDDNYDEYAKRLEAIGYEVDRDMDGSILSFNKKGEENKFDKATKYSPYQLEGEKENYKEVLVTLPSSERNTIESIIIDKYNDHIKDGNSKEVAIKTIQRWVAKDKSLVEIEKIVSKPYVKKPFKSSHFDEPNILVHLRMNTRTDSEGNKVLFLEEVQSDWGQQGKKEGFKKSVDERKKDILDTRGVKLIEVGNYYNVMFGDQMLTNIAKDSWNEGSSRTIADVERALNKYNPRADTPSAPFVMDTNAWTKLGLKVALKEAVKQGADKIAWTTGEQQNDRYDLSKQVDDISAFKKVDGTYEITARKNSQKTFVDKSVPENKLEGIVGKELAKKIIEDLKINKFGKTYEGSDLKVGGAGMKGFYGSPTEGSLGIVGNVAKSLFKQEVGTVEIGKEDVKPIQYVVYDRMRGNTISTFDTQKEANDYVKKEIEIGDDWGVMVEEKEPIKSTSTQHSIDITPELKASVEQGQPLFQLNDKGEILGFTYNGKIYLNGEKITANTTMEEAGHIWINWAKENRSDLYQQGIEKVLGSKYLIEVNNNPNYQKEALKAGEKGSEAYNAYMQEEALAKAIADNGAKFITETRKANFREWVTAMWKEVVKAFGIQKLTPSEVKGLTLEQFAKMAAADVFSNREVAVKNKKSNLTEEQAKFVRTPAFKKWFGDWESNPENSSKVVDENGEPLIVWHGTHTKNEFEKEGFDTKNGESYGTHFGTKKSAEDRLNDLSGEMFFEGNPRLIPAFLNIRNPIKLQDYNLEEYKKAEKDGYDGVIYINKVEDKGSTGYAIFDNSNIKTAKEVAVEPSAIEKGQVLGKGKTLPNASIQNTIDNANYAPRRKNSVMVRLPIDFVLDNQEKDFKVERGRNEIGNRIDKAKEFLSKNPKDLEASDIYIKDSGKDKGKIGFGDGRHRLIAAKELGATHAYFELPATKEQFDALNYLLSEFGNEKGIDQTELYSTQGDFSIIQTSDNTFLLNKEEDIYVAKLNELGGVDNLEVTKNGKKIKSDQNIEQAIQTHLQNINPESNTRNINKFLGEGQNPQIAETIEATLKGEMNADDAAVSLDEKGIEVTQEIYDNLRDAEKQYQKEKSGIQVGDTIMVKGKNGNPNFEANFRGLDKNGKYIVYNTKSGTTFSITKDEILTPANKEAKLTGLEQEVWENVLSKGQGLMVSSEKVANSDYPNLINNGLVYIDKQGAGKDVSLKLTEKGELAALKEQLKKAKLTATKNEIQAKIDALEGNEPKAPRSPSDGLGSRTAANTNTITPTQNAERVSMKFHLELKKLIEGIGVPIAERNLSKRFLGIFKHRSMNIRVQSLFGVATAAHETAHWVSKKFGIGESLRNKSAIVAANPNAQLNKDIRKALTNIYIEFYPNAKKEHSLYLRVEEGIAVLMEHYLTDPTDIANRYGILVDNFIAPTGLYYHPKFTELLGKLNNFIGEYSNLTPNEKIGSRIVSGEEVTKKNEGFTPAQSIVNGWVNSAEPLRRSDNIADAGLTDESAEVAHLRWLSRAGIIAPWITGDKHALTLDGNGNWKEVGASVKDYLKLIKGKEKEFSQYLVARRNLGDVNYLTEMENELAEILANIENEEDLTKEEIEEINELSARIEKLKKIIKNDNFDIQEVTATVRMFENQFERPVAIYDKLNNAVVDFAQKSGLLDSEKAEAYKANKTYASFKRLIIDDISSNVLAPGTSSQSQVSAFKQRSGSDLAIIDPIYSQIQFISETLNKGMQNMIWQRLAALGNDNVELARRFEKVETIRAVDPISGQISYPQMGKKGFVMVKTNGKPSFYLAAPEYVALAETLTPKELETMAFVLTKAAGIFSRLTTSANPLFPLVNIPIDTISAWMNTKTGFIPGWSQMRVIPQMASYAKDKAAYSVKNLANRAIDILHNMAIIGKWFNGIKNIPIKDLSLEEQNLFAKYLALGGSTQTLAAYQNMSPEDMIKAITEKNLIKKAVQNIDDFTLGILEMPSNASEYMTRFAEFKRAKDQGYSDDVAMYMAAHVSVPFIQSGTYGGQVGKTIVKSVPYFHAGIQVLSKFIETAKNNPTRTATIGAALIAIKISQTLLTMALSDDDDKRMLAEQEPSEFGKYIYVPNKIFGGKGFTRIRFSSEFGSISAPIEMMILQNKGLAHYGFKDYLDATTTAVPQQFNIFKPVEAVWAYAPQLVKPTLEVGFNVRTYPNIRPIVPYGISFKSPMNQYNQYTTETSKYLGKLMGLSPMKIDYFMKAQFGKVPDMLVRKIEQKWFDKEDKSRSQIFLQEEQYVLAGKNYTDFYEKNKYYQELYNDIHVRKHKGEFTQEQLEIIENHKIFDKTEDKIKQMREKVNANIEIPEYLKQSAFELLIELNSSDKPYLLNDKYIKFKNDYYRAFP